MKFDAKISLSPSPGSPFLHGIVSEYLQSAALDNVSWSMVFSLKYARLPTSEDLIFNKPSDVSILSLKICSFSFGKKRQKNFVSFFFITNPHTEKKKDYFPIKKK